MQLPVATSTVATLAWSLSTGQINHNESGYIHSDARGSVVARTALTKTGTAVTTPDSKAEYGAWGDTVAYSGVSVPRYQYTNEEPDPGTGYYYFGARPYDPTLRRWLAPDPLVMGDLAIDAQVGTQLNLYSYVGNNPVMLTDRTGLLGDTPAGWERSVEASMATTYAEHPREYALAGVAAAAGAGALALSGAAAGTIARVAVIVEATFDVGNVSAAAADFWNNTSVVSAAGFGLALLDLATGPASPVALAGETNSGRIAANKSMGGGGGSSDGQRKGVVEKTESGRRVGDFTRSQKNAAKSENAAANGGEMKCADCRKPVENVKSEKGIPTPAHQAQVHHDPAIVEGGGRHSTPIVVCPECHKKKHANE